MTNRICEKCKEPLAGHEIPYSNKLRDCATARLYNDCPDSHFCRHPSVCSKTHKCVTQEKYGVACND